MRKHLNLHNINIYIAFILLILPILAHAESDPFTKAGTGMSNILFGAAGTSIVGIIIGVTFKLAQLGKVSWDKFLQVTYCAAGFFGAPSIAMLIKGWVST